MDILKLSNLDLGGKSLPKQAVMEYCTSEHILNEKESQNEKYLWWYTSASSKTSQSRTQKKESLALEHVGGNMK